MTIFAMVEDWYSFISLGLMHFVITKFLQKCQNMHISCENTHIFDYYTLSLTRLQDSFEKRQEFSLY